MGQYLPVLVLGILATLFAAISLFASRLLNPGRPTAAKNAPYECGIVDQVAPPERFPVRFFLVAMIFIVFDIEIIFLYPYTTVYQELGAFGILSIIEFAAAVFASFLYAVASGALDWGPLKQIRRSGIMVDAQRSLGSTIRRVGLEGRDETEAAAAPDEVAA